MIEVKVKPERLIFPKSLSSGNSDSSFKIYACRPIDNEEASKVKLNDYHNMTIKGDIFNLNMGETYIVTIQEEKSRYRGSYILLDVRQAGLSSIEEQKDFLSNILTDYQVRNIYEKYCNGENVIDMIMDDSFEYEDIKGIGDKTFEVIKERVEKNISDANVLSFAQKYGISNSVLKKLEKEYKSKHLGIEAVKENPYILTNLGGIGFLKADEIAIKIGVEQNDPNRIESAIVYEIELENASGHSWLKKQTLINRCVSLLDIRKVEISEVLDNMDSIYKKDDKYSLIEIYETELYISNKIKEIDSDSDVMFESSKVDKFLDSYSASNLVDLEPEQRKFFHNFNENRISLLIGYGGTGKSWVQNILLEMIDSFKKDQFIALLAPTGRASKVMSGYTKRDAYTIHRYLMMNRDEYGESMIFDDIIIIDESSMCDVFLIKKLLLSIKNPKSRILFVGDDFQLPSVGVGNFLYDCINSHKITTTKLNKVFRQKEGGIRNISSDIREDVTFLNHTDSGLMKFGNDCIAHFTESEYVLSGIEHYYKRLLSKYKQEEIAVITPTNKGNLGAININKSIQAVVNPPSPEKKEKKFGKKDNPMIVRVGDLVLNTKNTYDCESTDGRIIDVFNGDVGNVIDIVKEGDDEFVIIDFEGYHVKFLTKDVFTNILHGWSMTIHKMQGSQCKVVITVSDKSATFQLNANLLYTGKSRATEYMIMLGQASSINQGMKKKANMTRRSFLKELLESS